MYSEDNNGHLELSIKSWKLFEEGEFKRKGRKVLRQGREGTSILCALGALFLCVLCV
jgi:hypothetical protein